MILPENQRMSEFYMVCYGKVDESRQWSAYEGPFRTREDGFRAITNCALRCEAIHLSRESTTKLYQYLLLILPNDEGLITLGPEHNPLISKYFETRVRFGVVTYEQIAQECIDDDEFFQYQLVTARPIGLSAPPEE